MSDLISRSEVIKIIDELGYINCYEGKDFEANNRVDKIRQRIVEMPVAYDVDKVVEGKGNMDKLRRCKGKCNIYENGKWNRLEFELGYFHEWGMNYEDFESGVGNYSVAIVELPDGRIVMPPADDIVFLDLITE